MSIPGYEIYRCYDEIGPIRVFEDGMRRYLAFGEDSQQSCVDLANPATLVFEYTQAMALALLYQPTPKQTALLGLGAGSLVHCLQKYDPQMQLNIVELRSKVAEVAQQWFALEISPATSLHFGDAGDYMSNAEHDKCDLIFADIYNDDGMIQMQLSEIFLKHCYDHLNYEGVLVLNLWDEGGGSHPLAIQRIQDLFGDHCLTCLVEGGNLIVYAFKGGLPQINTRRLQPQAKRLAKQLNFPVQKLIEHIKQG